MEEVQTKTCSECKKEQPTTNFGVNTKVKSGLSYHCKTCNRKKNKAWRSKSNYEVKVNEKKCCRCNETKLSYQFTKSKNSKDGLQSYCKKCVVLRISAAFYKISVEKVVELRSIKKCQNEACGVTLDLLNIDHCHKTGKVRGVLCTQCNHMLGNAKDDPKKLRGGARYLEKHHGKRIKPRKKSQYSRQLDLFPSMACV